MTASSHAELLTGPKALLHHTVSFETTSAFLIPMFFIAAHLGESLFFCFELTAPAAWGQKKPSHPQCTYYPAGEKLHVNENFSHFIILELE